MVELGIRHARREVASRHAPRRGWRGRHRSAAGIALTDLAWLDDFAGTWSCAELPVMHEASVPPLPARKIKKCLMRPLREQMVDSECPARRLASSDGPGSDCDSPGSSAQARSPGMRLRTRPRPPVSSRTRIARSQALR